MVTIDIELTKDDLKRLGAELTEKVGKELGRRKLDAGAYLAKAVQNSMKTTPRSRDAPAGSPPFSHSYDAHGNKLSSNLKKGIKFVADPQAGSVVVGPASFNSRVVIPALMEFGGTLQVGNSRRRERKIGDGGEIEIVGAGETPKPEFFDSRGARRRLTRKTTKAVLRDPLGRRVVYAKLRTSAQVRRANEFNELLYGSWTVQTGTYAPHPYLGPAFDRVAATGKFDDIIGELVRSA